MSKPEADPASGISLGDVLRLPKRHPACRRREANQALGRNVRTWPAMPREKAQGFQNCEAESTDAPERGGLPRSSAEAG